MGDTILGFITDENKRILDLVSLTDSSLVIVFRSHNSMKNSIGDLKSYFIRKEKYEKLTPEQIISLKAPNESDSLFLVQINKKETQSDTGQLGVHVVAHVMPTYPGGDNALNNFLKKNLNCPTKFSGKAKVWMSFIVEPNGEITNVEVWKGVNAECNKEAIRIIELMPNWTPGHNYSEPLRIKMRFPVNFICN